MADIEEEVWRLPGTVKGQDVKGGGSHRPPSLSYSAKARLARIVRRAPEVMVKVTGRARGVAGLNGSSGLCHSQCKANGRDPRRRADPGPHQPSASSRRLADDQLCKRTR